MHRTSMFVAMALSWLILACSNSPKEKIAAQQSGEAAGADKPTNYLQMKINGKLWEADHDIFAAFHPQGYDRAIIIAGSKGPKDKNEQTFNINLYNTSGPATFNIATGNTDKNVVQIANLTPENYLYGSVMGFNFKIIVTKASSNPTVVEASFEGELMGNASDKLLITDGKFSYHE